MATESITKNFVLKDEKAVIRFFEIQKKPPKKTKELGAYEEGKKLLKRMFSR